MDTYSFNISLSVLNDLGRNLYRNFITVLGEAISNSWDADAENVYIDIDREKNMFTIQDDGDGMTSEDFQNKFLKIGYSKRKGNVDHTVKGRPFIGRKGIGKLALLSCAKKITILTKTESSELVGGIIDNSSLNEAIKDDISAKDYKLKQPNSEFVEKYKSKFTKGTILLFEDINEGIKNKIEYIGKLIALYFRFSLLDPSFNIFLNGSTITLDNLNELTLDTQFLWTINNPTDPYVSEKLMGSDNLMHNKNLELEIKGVTGFIASVTKPSELKVRGTDEKVTIDLFVNGRLREKDILKHKPTARIVENYLYGQIHYNQLDDGTDRFTSSREGIVSNDPKFEQLLNDLESLIKTIIEDWDIWRTENRETGDSENHRMTLKERKSKELFNTIADGFIPPKDAPASREKVNAWLNELSQDAEFNFASYGECFVSENLLRKYIKNKAIDIPSRVSNSIVTWKNNAEGAKNRANINFEIREDNSDLSYCDMDTLSYIADDEPEGTKKASLRRDSVEYKPIRDAMAHTSRLTNIAKSRLNITYENIKERIIQLLNRA
jgi:hypothetical protein